MLDMKDAQIKQTLPESIKYDQKVNDICVSVQAEFDAANKDSLLVLLLPRLNELSEALIDELAWQFHVDFYRDNFPLETKRNLVRTAIERHRYKGTPKAVEEVVSTVYQYAKVEEWFEYGGDPYYFRVLLTAMDPAPPLSLNEVIKLIDEYKSKRSWLEGIYYHIPHDLVIGTHFGYVCYRHRMCGTYPTRRRYGSIERHDIVIDTEKGSILYDNPHTGELSTGMFPRRFKTGDISDEALVVDTEKGGMVYENPYTGELVSGTFPEAKSEGSIDEGGIVVETESTVQAYDHIKAGTVPSDTDGGIMANTAVTDIPYSVRYCGSPLGSLF